MLISTGLDRARSTTSVKLRDLCSSAFRQMPGGTPDRNTVEFGIGVGEYESVARVSKRVFQILVPDAPTPERCVEAYHIHRTRLELIAERKFRRRLLTDDAKSRSP